MTTRKYRAYMRSEEWKAFRERAIEAARNKCWVQRHPAEAWSGCFGGLEVHHLHYKTLGRERLSDVEVFCAWHHQTADKVRKSPRLYACWADADAAVHGNSMALYQEAVEAAGGYSKLRQWTYKVSSKGGIKAVYVRIIRRLTGHRPHPFRP